MNAPALWSVFTLGAKKVLAQRLVLLGQITVYCVLVSCYALFFTGIAPEALQRFALSPADLVWYVAITQIVVGCIALHWRDLETEIQAGAIEVQMLRPVPFWTLALAEWFGQYFVRAAIVAPFGCLVAWSIAGPPSLPSPGGLLLLAPCVLVGGLIFLCLHWMVGCASHWASPAEPVYRFTQKLAFLVGGRAAPFAIYPAWAGVIGCATPFAAMFGIPANMILGRNTISLPLQIALQLAWLSVALWAAALSARALRRALMVNG